MYLRTVNMDGSIIVSLLAPKSKVVLKQSAWRPAIEIIRCGASHWLAFHALQFLNATLECHCWTDSTITRLAESVTFPIENLYRQSCFGCAIISSWSFLTSCFDTQSRGISRFRSRYFQDMIYGDQALHDCIILPRLGRPHVLRDPPMFLWNNAQSLYCTLHQIGISRRVILRDQNCYELSFIYNVF